MKQRRVLEATLGVYAATLLVTAATLAGWESGAADLSAGVFVATGVAIAAVVCLSIRGITDLADRLLSLPVVVLTVCLPLLYLPYMIFLVDPDSGAGVIAIVGLCAVLPGMLSVLGGTLIRNRRLREQSTEIVTVTLGESEDTQRELRIAAVMIVAITLIAVGVATILTGDISTTTFITLVGGLSPVFLLFAENGRELAVTDIGLRIEQSITVWDDLAGYRLTDEKIVLVGSQWHQFNRTFDREDISDEDALIEGLEGFLPRLDKHGRVELSAQR
jgi:hypothetical protein